MKKKITNDFTVEGMGLYKDKNYAGAYIMFNTLMLSNPENVDVQRMVGICQTKLGWYDEAEYTLKKCKILGGSNYNLNLHYGYVMIMQRCLEAAYEYLTDCTNNQPEKPLGYILLAASSIIDHDNEKAINLLNCAKNTKDMLDISENKNKELLQKVTKATIDKLEWIACQDGGTLNNPDMLSCISGDLCDIMGEYTDL
jgi:predicted Zn-dependent protease